ncbi:hypothetical protein [Desulfosporosinus sp. OT]|uniref:hypothetical protein n=1 Tax=Desulfosporosinus sp. OT TaxID=913865 RepID=UPI000223B23E|nr:hypothetical protein [Desulfosporosinus sp. OT]EGW38798.1 hypothetical protein DOT_3267 [Desulfosporosinus sp. OT]
MGLGVTPRQTLSDTGKYGSDSQGLESRYYCLASEVFQTEYTTRLWEFSMYTDQATKAQTVMDLKVLNGLLQGYQNDSPFLILNLNGSVNEKTLDQIIAPLIQKPLWEVVAEMDRYLDVLNRTIIQPDKLEELKQKQADLKEIHDIAEILRGLDVKEPKNEVRYHENVEKLLSITQKLH